MIVAILSALTLAHDDKPVYLVKDDTTTTDSGWAATVVVFLLVLWCAIYASFWGRLCYEDCQLQQGFAQEHVPQAKVVYATHGAQTFVALPPLPPPQPQFSFSDPNELQWIDKDGDVCILRKCEANVQLHVKWTSRGDSCTRLVLQNVTTYQYEATTGDLLFYGQGGEVHSHSAMFTHAPEFPKFMDALETLFETRDQGSAKALGGNANVPGNESSLKPESCLFRL